MPVSAGEAAVVLSEYQAVVLSEDSVACLSCPCRQAKPRKLWTLDALQVSRAMSIHLHLLLGYICTSVCRKLWTLDAFQVSIALHLA